MNWHSLINVQIRHDIFDLFGLGFNFIIGIAAIFSLWISRKALKKSEWDSAMSTSPSIVIRPSTIQVWTKHNNEGGYGIHMHGQQQINKSSAYSEVVFVIEFECFNAGRGVAFNISQPKTMGIPLSDFRDNKTPLYLTKEDGSFTITVWQKKTFEEFYKIANEETPVTISLMYTNDQNNVFCRSLWSANIKPFDVEGENLKTRDIRLLKRIGKIEYSRTPYEK